MAAAQHLVFELQFDGASELRIRRLCEQLARQFALQPGPGSLAPPHVTLAMFPGPEPADALALATALATAISPFQLDLSSVGTFPGTEGVVFLKPGPSNELAHAHQVFCDLLGTERRLLHPYYEHARWEPHCTLALGIAAALLPDVLRAAESSTTSGSARVERLEVNRYFPLTRVCGVPLRATRS